MDGGVQLNGGVDNDSNTAINGDGDATSDDGIIDGDRQSISDDGPYGTDDDNSDDEGANSSDGNHHGSNELKVSPTTFITPSASHSMCPLPYPPHAPMGFT